MRPRELTLLLQDIQGCIAQIDEFTEGMSFEQFKMSALVQRAVERDFSIIGEAITRMRRVSEEVGTRIDHALRIAGFRNLLVHDYEVIDEAIVWNSAKTAFPMLKQQIDQWAVELGMEPPTLAPSTKTAS